MENKEIEAKKKKLLSLLTPMQQNYFEAIDWLFNGPRASGRTRAIVATALIHVLNWGDGVVIDHYPAPYTKSYIKNMIHEMADEIELPVKIKEYGSGFIVTRNLDPLIEYKPIKI